MEQATHVSVVNYDEELSICSVVEDRIYFNETEGISCKVFSNRYMKYIIKENAHVEAQLFDFKTRTKNIMTLEEKGLNLNQVL
jgi:hypothetical protein